MVTLCWLSFNICTKTGVYMLYTVIKYQVYRNSAYHTLPDVLMPFHIQRYTMTQARTRHRHRSHLMLPGYSIPSDIPRALFLQIEHKLLIYPHTISLLITIYTNSLIYIIKYFHAIIPRKLVLKFQNFDYM